MIHIKFHIQGNKLKTIKNIQFGKNNEKNLDVIYGITKESIERNKKSELEQVIIICCFHIVNEIRKNTIIEIIQEKVLDELLKHSSIMQILKEIKNIHIEARIDNFPKKILDFTFKHKEHLF